MTSQGHWTCKCYSVNYSISLKIVAVKYRIRVRLQPIVFNSKSSSIFKNLLYLKEKNNSVWALALAFDPRWPKQGHWGSCIFSSKPRLHNFGHSLHSGPHALFLFCLLAAGQCLQNLSGPFGHEYVEEGVHKRAEVEQQVGHQPQVAHSLLKAQSLQEDTEDEGDVKEGVVSPDGSDTPHRPPPLCCCSVGSRAHHSSPGVHGKEEEEGERAEHCHGKPKVVLQHGQGQDAKRSGPGDQDDRWGLTDSSAAADTLRVGHQEVTLLGNEEHKGDVGDYAKVEDEVGGIGGEEGSSLLDLVLVHGGATKETDDIGHQEEDDMHGDFTITYDRGRQILDTHFSLPAHIFVSYYRPQYLSNTFSTFGSCSLRLKEEVIRFQSTIKVTVRPPNLWSYTVACKCFLLEIISSFTCWNVHINKKFDQGHPDSCHRSPHQPQQDMCSELIICFIPYSFFTYSI